MLKVEETRNQDIYQSFGLARVFNLHELDDADRGHFGRALQQSVGHIEACPLLCNRSGKAYLLVCGKAAVVVWCLCR